MDPAIMALMEITPEEDPLLTAEGINNGEDLMTAEHDVILAALPTATTMKCRKLTQIGRHIAHGEMVTRCAT